MGGTQAFSAGFITALETSLVAAGVGNGTLGVNQYGLVGFGGATPHTAGHGHPLGAGGALWGSAVQYVTAAAGLVTNGGFEDGYDGISFALTNYAFRPNAAKFLVLATDEDRDVLTPALTFNSIVAATQAANANLHGILSVTLADGTGTAAVAVDGQGKAFLPNGAGGYTLGTGGVITGMRPLGAPGTITEYANLVFAVNPTSLVGDIQSIAQNPLTSQSFAAALITTIVAQSGGGGGQSRAGGVSS